MFPLAIVLGSVGAILILVGLVGGDFTFSGTVIPKVGRMSRVLSFSVGGLLVLSAIFVVLLDPSVQSSASAATQNSIPATVPATPSASSPTNDGNYTETDQAVVSVLRGQPSFQGQTDADLIDASKAACVLLARGYSGSDIVATAISAGASPYDAGFFLGIAVQAYCPTYWNVATST